ncbi:hypothetical protein RRG08_061028 [Elysia crispata]|uniref:Uncharacterized protein n=1 Tax=Elysia crispata TaxID=231223 RepID=A0AAE1AVB2_9GAST|nr:hypothetical protein RRG08_061028 [Elysia crispata]
MTQQARIAPNWQLGRCGGMRSPHFSMQLHRKFQSKVTERTPQRPDWNKVSRAKRGKDK